MYDFVLLAVPTVCVTYALHSVGDPTTGIPAAYVPGWISPPPPPPTGYVKDKHNIVAAICGDQYNVMFVTELPHGLSTGTVIVIEGNSNELYNVTDAFLKKDGNYAFAVTSLTYDTDGIGGTWSTMLRDEPATEDLDERRDTERVEEG